jgi:hypothetical protein
MTKPIQPESVEPCPFCGGTDAFVERASFSDCYVVCNDCGAKGPPSCDENEADADASESGECEPGEMPARRLWNTRIASTTPTDEAVEASDLAKELLAQSFERSGEQKCAEAVRRGKVAGFGTPLWMDEALFAIRTALHTALSTPTDATAVEDERDDTEARRLYNESTANDPDIHCNRFPAWSELTEKTRDYWRARTPREG